jgi:PAS domain-containing protein
MVTSFDRLFGHFPDAMILLGAEGGCLSANRACQSLFLCQQDRFKSLKVDIFRQNAWELQRFRTTLERNDSIKNFRVCIRHSDDSEMDCSFTATAWRDQDSRLIGYAVMIQRQ